MEGLFRYPRTKWGEGVVKKACTGASYNALTVRENGSGQTAQLWGERAFDCWTKQHRINSSYKDTHSYDFLLTTREGAEVRVDVKTKDRTVAMQPHFNVAVYAYQSDFDCDLYVFANMAPNAVCLLGWHTKHDFWRDCIHVKKGEPDGPNFVHVEDSGIMMAKFLRPMDELWQGFTTPQWLIDKQKIGGKESNA